MSFGRKLRRFSAPASKAKRVVDQFFPSLRAALAAVGAQAAETTARSQFAAYIDESDPGRVIMQFASRGYWLERARSEKFRRLLAAVEHDTRVFILDASAGEGRSLLLGDALAEEGIS